MTPLLEISDLRVSYGRTAVLHGVSLHVQKRGITALLGANGAGKTSTIRALFGVVGSHGAVSFDGKPISGLPTEAIASMGIAHVPDNRGTFLHLTVLENLRVGAHIRRDREIAADIERYYDYFPRLRQRASQQAGTLSGGEQQMLALSRAMMMRPRLLVLDEPSFGLAPLVVGEIFEMLARINREQGVGILLVEQNANMALRIAQQAYVLESGHIVLQGTAAELQTDERVKRSYLGI